MSTVSADRLNVLLIASVFLGKNVTAVAATEIRGQLLAVLIPIVSAHAFADSDTASVFSCGLAFALLE